MVEILAGFLSIFKWFFVMLDTITFGLIDNVYNLITIFASGEMFDSTAIEELMRNTYVIIGIFAFFKLAMAFVNAMINPDKLFDSEKGVGSVAKNFIIMFVLLIAVPLAFDLLMEAQKIIVNGNYINKIFLNNDTKAKNPGKMMEKTAVESLIYINDDVYKWEEVKDENGNLKMVKTDELKSECKSNCQEAIDEYNGKIKNSDGVSWGTIMANVGVSIEADLGNGNEEIYVYNYTILVTTIVGGFITYVLAGFAFDIAVRTVELAVLEVIAPLFIVTYIDPKSAKSGPFHNWLTTVGKTYASLFIKLAILALMFALLGLLDNFGFDGIPGGAMAKLFMLLAILAFAKKAPGWISSLIGIKESEAGLGGLGKKLAALPLVGAGLTKAGHALAGGARGAAGLIHRNNQNRRAIKKEARNELGYKRGITNNARNSRKALYEKLKTENPEKYADKSKRKVLRDAKNDIYREKGVGKGSSIAQVGAAAFTGALVGGKVGLNASDLKGAFTSAKGAATKQADYLALTKKPGTKVGNWVRDLPETVEGAWGDPNDLYKRRKEIQDAKNARFHSGGKYQAGLGLGKIVEGNGDAVKLFKKYSVAKEGEHLLAQYCETNGKSTVEFNSLKSGISKMADGSFQCKIDGRNVNLNESLYINGTGGAENLSKMFNTYQTNALANSSESQKQYMQQASAYQGILNTQNNVAQQAQAITAALSKSLPSALSGITIDSTSMAGVKNAIKDLNDNMSLVSGEEQENLGQKLDELKKLSANYDYSGKQGDIIKTSMDNLRETIDNLAPIVQNIPGGTVTEKQQQLSLDLTKLDKTLEGIKKPSDDK